MRKTTVWLIILACLPVGIIITALVKRGPTHQGISARVWFSQVRMMEQSPSLEALKAMGKSAVPVIQADLKAEKIGYRIKAAWVLGELGTAAQAAVPELIRALDDADPMVRLMTVKSLTAIIEMDKAGNELVSKLISKLNDPAPGISQAASDLLDRIEQERKAKHLSPFIDNDYDYTMALTRSPIAIIRVKGAWRLANLPPGDKRVAAALASLLNDSDELVRVQTAKFMAHPNVEMPGWINPRNSP